MSPVTKQLNQMIDQLGETEQLLILEIVKRFIADDVATPDDLEAIAISNNEYNLGETINHNAIDWDNLDKYVG